MSIGQGRIAHTIEPQGSKVPTRNVVSKPLAATGPEAASAACHYPFPHSAPHRRRVVTGAIPARRTRAFAGATTRVTHRAGRGLRRGPRFSQVSATSAPSAGVEAGAAERHAQGFGPDLAKPTAWAYHSSITHNSSGNVKLPRFRGRLKTVAIKRSDVDPLDLVERDLLTEAIVELGGAGGLVPGDPGRDLEVAAVSKVLGDPGAAEAVRADLGR